MSMQIHQVSKENIHLLEYLKACSYSISKQHYLELEKRRKNKEWVSIIINQKFKCFYCRYDIRNIQQLIIKGDLGLRKRGRHGYSGLHFELDHKNANKNDNSAKNLVAACYYCNNDKSNTISDEVFLKYFGPQRKLTFKKLFKDSGLKESDLFVHNLSLNSK